jgi:hypothetical protein
MSIGEHLNNYLLRKDRRLMIKHKKNFPNSVEYGKTVVLE